MNPNEEAPLEIVGSDAINAIERGQIDMQVSTSKKYPRSVKAFLTEAESMITMSQEVAEGCNYKLKRKDSSQPGGVKIIAGPSIRLMEIAATSYGNMRYGSRIVAIDQDYVTAQGVAIDMQKNLAITVEVQRSIKGKFGRYSNDMIMVTCNAAGSIARRNALLGVIPRVYINHLSDAAKRFAIGDAKSLPERLQRAFAYFTTVLGVELSKVLAYLEKASVEDCTLEDLGELQDLKTMLKDGEVSIETAFSEPWPTGTQEAETPDLGGKAVAPATPPSPVAASVSKVLEPVTATAPQAATPTTTRKKKAAAAPAPVEPPTVAAPPTQPPPEEAAPVVVGPAEPVEVPAIVLARRLHDSNVPVDDFFDWLKTTGLDKLYKFDADKVENMSDLPEKLMTDLLTDATSLSSTCLLSVCIRIFGVKKA